MYAIIDSGGKQYRVEEGQKVSVERLPGEVGDQVTFDRVLFVGGDSPSIGAPTVDGVTVQGTIEEHGRGSKIVVFKFKRRKMYRRKSGHRQAETVVKIDSIAGGAAKRATAKSVAGASKPKAKAASGEAAEPQPDETGAAQAEE